MAESLAAIGLAGNIIQFISFSFVLVSKTKELHQSASGVLNEHVDLNIVSQDIRHYSSKIDTTSSITQLDDVAHRCDVVARELLDAIAELQHRQHVSSSGKVAKKWQSFRTALKGLWGKAHIEELKARLELLRDQVTMHLVSDTHDNQIQLMDLLVDWKNQNMQASYKFTAQIQGLDDQLQAAQRRISDLQGDAFWKKLYDPFVQLSSEVHQVSRCHRIIESLRYECMHIRESAIKDAHRETFAWIYTSHDLDSSVTKKNAEFSRWLESSSGIYWINGKPGSGKSTLMKYLFDHDDTARHLQVWSGNAPLVKACFYFWLPGQQMQGSLEGLLQTLLHHILHACPELAPEMCPERWNTESQPQYQSHGITPPRPWTLSELRRSFTLFRTQNTVTTKFYFQVDGLDEYCGDSWEVIETLKDLSTAPNVKLCLSSRPWNCFQDAFGKVNPHVLRLHEFTKPDIELFAQENLLSHGPHMRHEPSLFEDLIRDIGDRAQGVFLWVRLVVKSLRSGIDNDDPISILQERLRVIPSDLEDLFEQMIYSVDEVYRSRMAGTFLAAMGSPSRMKLIHYYFLERGNPIFGFDIPSKIWQESDIQNRAVQTERRLNGRFRGLLEAASTGVINAHTRVDFMHRTLSDFLATKNMRDKLQSWAPQNFNVFTNISHALIAESKLIENRPSPSAFRLAIELASKGATETGNVAHCYEVINQSELGNERMRPLHSRCGLNCYILRFAASIGHTEYLKYRLDRDGAELDLDRILTHAISCPVDPAETYDSCLPIAFIQHRTSTPCNVSSASSSLSSIGYAPLPSLVKALFEQGADPNAVVDGTSSWMTLVDEAVMLLEGEHKEQCWAVIELFLEQGVDVNMATEYWIEMLDRMDPKSESSLRDALRYFKCLLSHGLDPNTKNILQILTQTSHHISSTSLNIRHEILHEFLRAGTDISMIYKDTIRHGWLQTVCQEIRHNITLAPLSTRTAQYRILLEHGLDPNMTTCSGHTVWKAFLCAIDQGISQGLRDHQTAHDIILMSLQYGADPHTSTISRIISWMKINQSVLSGNGVDDIERALKRETDQRKCRAQSRPHLESRFYSPSGIGNFGKSCISPAVTQHKTLQARKRDRTETSHYTQVRYSKRVCFTCGGQSTTLPIAI